MTTKKTEPAAQAGAPAVDPALFAQVLENQRDLESKNVLLLGIIEQLTGAKPGVLPAAGAVRRKPAEMDEPPRVLPTRKLLFIGTRLNAEHGVLEPDLYAGPNGPVYVCGLGGSPLIFQGTREDERPHVMVHQSFGDYLIQHDRRRDSLGRLLAERYAWADPLPPAEEA